MKLPEEYVNFFVEYVECQDAQSVVPLHGAGRTVLVECTFCHAGKNGDHRVVPRLLRQIAEFQNFRAVAHESATQKHVDEQHVEDLRKIK